MCKLRKELPPVNLVAVTCDSWSGMTGKLVPGSIIVCSMGSSTARGVKITGVCRSPPLPDGVGRRRLAVLSGLPDSAARRQNFFGSYCMATLEMRLDIWLPVAIVDINQQSLDFLWKHECVPVFYIIPQQRNIAGKNSIPTTTTTTTTTNFVGQGYNNNISISYLQYHGCRWLGNARSQHISRMRTMLTYSAQNTLLLNVLGLLPTVSQ